MLGTSSSSSRTQQRPVTIRRQLVAALPGSPLAVVACPSMVLFVSAFYLLHTILTLAFAPAECADLLHFCQRIILFVALLALTHLALLVPNFIRHALQADLRSTPRDVPRSSISRHSDTGPLAFLDALCGGPNITPRRRCLTILYFSTYVAQQLAWAFLLIDHLYVNWKAYGLIRATVDALQLPPPATLMPLEATAPYSAGLPPMRCGVGESVHVIRWSVICLMVTTAVVLSLLIVCFQETLLYAGAQLWRAAALRKRQKSRAATAASHDGTSSPVLRAWIDLQTEEVRDEPDDREDLPLREAIAV